MKREPRAIEDIYTDIFSTRSISITLRDPQWRLLCKELESGKPVSVLDLGCGDGKYSELMAQVSNAHVVGVDLMLFKARNVTSIRASLDEVEFANQSFDFIVGLSSFHYSTDIHRLMRRCYAMLADGGTLVMTNHTKFSLSTVYRRVANWLTTGTRFPHLRGLSFHSIADWIKAADEAGFVCKYSCGWRFESRLERLLLRISSKMKCPIDLFGFLRFGIRHGLAAETAYHSWIALQKPQVFDLE